MARGGSWGRSSWGGCIKISEGLTFASCIYDFVELWIGHPCIITFHGILGCCRLVGGFLFVGGLDFLGSLLRVFSGLEEGIISRLRPAFIFAETPSGSGSPAPSAGIA